MTDINRVFQETSLTASAPCRVDFGGTLDIPSFYIPLFQTGPMTFNMALDMRTTVRVSGYEAGQVRVESRGFAPAQFPAESAPYDHPMGLIFALAASFGVEGVLIEIASDSPPRSALGGSSVAAVALTAIFMRAREMAGGPRVMAEDVVLRAHAVESMVAGVPCGYQDQLAAAFGGINAWYWESDPAKRPWMKRTLVWPDAYDRLRDCTLVAYGGNPHDSRDVNGRWVREFIKGNSRESWLEIVALARTFCTAMEELDMASAVRCIQEEVRIRTLLTPDVLDGTGTRLVETAERGGCGARFVGAGGGGCIWAVGTPDAIALLRPVWEGVLSETDGGCILDAGPDAAGILFAD